MKILSFISSSKGAGKTFLSSLTISSLCYQNYSVAYYKPFQMNIENNHLPDIDFIKHSSPLASEDIHSSFGFAGDISPLFSTNQNIPIKEIRNFLFDSKNKYDIMVMEGIGIYEPISESEIFFDVISDTFLIDNEIIMVSSLDDNIIDNTLSTVEAVYSKGKTIKMLIINQKQENIYDLETIEKILLYIKKSLHPIPIFFMPYLDKRENILYNKKPMVHKYFNSIAEYILSFI